MAKAMQKKSDKSFVVYYENDKCEYVCYNKDIGIKIYKSIPNDKYNCFHFIKYEDKHNKDFIMNDDELIIYYNKFVEWNNELTNNKIYNKFDYTTNYSHFHAVGNFFNRFYRNNADKFEPIELEEHNIINECMNCGLTYCEKGKYENLYGYDFSMNYATLLSSESFRIPTKKPDPIIYKTLPKDYKNIKNISYWHVKITSDNEDMKKIFKFNDTHWYSHYSLIFAMKYQKKYNINLELIQDGKYNMYSYKTKDYMLGSDIFGEWYDILKKLRNEYPNNKLIKHLASSLWGSLTHMNTKNINSNDDLSIYDFKNKHYLVDIITKRNGEEYYEIAERGNLYKFNLRIKALITSLARNNIAEVIMTDIKNIVHVNTDGCICKNPIKYTKFEGLRVDKKHTGQNIEIINLYKFEKY